MSKVLVIGESWFTYTVHQKGFDAFYTAEYTEGGDAFIKSVESAGNEVTYIPSHEIHTRFPVSELELDDYDTVVISDVGANSFQLTKDTFNNSIPTPDKTVQIRDYVARGGNLLMIGGYLTFSGIDSKARWGRSPLGEALPVQVLDRDDRVELPSGVEPLVQVEHPVVAGLDTRWPVLLGLNEIVAREDSAVLVTCGDYPLVVVGTFGNGRTAAFASDVAPHWAPPEFLAWPGYDQLWANLFGWLAARES